MSSIAALRDFLLGGRNADGGWGYYPGKASRLEPTCWATLALHGLIDDEVLRPTLARWPSRDGVLLERAGGIRNYGFHALALLTLGATGVEHAAGNAALLEALQRAGGLRLPQSTINRQDNHLEGWSWIGDTFSWVEPTAWGVLALKRARARGITAVDPDRLKEPDSLLLDRVCATGGWNYGNSNMLGRELHAYASTTAIALLALQDRRSEPFVRRSLDFLDRQATWECSAYALSLATVAFRIFAIDTAPVSDVLERQLSTTYDLRQQLGSALALYALRDDHRDAAFRLEDATGG